MRILLIAAEFPPSPSPQSLRWMYLASALANRGLDVHVMCPDRQAGAVSLPVPEGVQVHPVFPGPVEALLGWAARRRGGVRAQEANPAPMQPAPQGLNWRGKVRAGVDACVGALVFPDARGEWWPFARRRLAGLIERVSPDVVVASHEPATSLQLGRLAGARGLPWVADLGDPVLTRYTPRRWRRRALALEAAVWREADAVVATTQHALDLLGQRHGPRAGACTVVTQGHASDAPVADGGQPDAGAPQGRCDLLYTGSFYSFRDAGPLLTALRSRPGLRLVVAARDVPAWLRDLARGEPDRFRLLGHLPHEEVLARQRGAGVLLSLGNAMPEQVPGKLFEYLGAGRPILHLRHPGSAPGAPDAADALLAATGAGLACAPEESAIGQALDRLTGRWPPPDAGQQAARMAHAWPALGARYADLLAAVATRAADALPPGVQR